MRTELSTASRAVLERLRRRIKRYDNLRVNAEGDNYPYVHHKRFVIRPKLIAARARVEAGLYGICADCGGSIDKERLKKVLAPLRCIKCEDSS